MYPMLFIERGNRFGTGQLAARSMHGLVSKVVIYGPQNRFDQIAAVIDFGNDAVDFMCPIAVNGSLGGLVRTELAAPIVHEIEVWRPLLPARNRPPAHS